MSEFAWLLVIWCFISTVGSIIGTLIAFWILGLTATKVD